MLALQFVHAVAYAAAYIPATQDSKEEVDAQYDPDGHAMQELEADDS